MKRMMETLVLIGKLICIFMAAMFIFVLAVVVAYLILNFKE